MSVIPKIAFTFWEGPQLTYLHALTIITFQKYNPDFEIIIYTSNTENSHLVKWKSGEQSKQYTNLYDINFLKNIPNVKFEEVDVNKILNYDGPLSCVWKSDIIRLLKLYEHGGMYIDFDILFIKKIPESLFNIDKLMFNTYQGVINNAVIISKKENYILKIIIEAILNKIQTNDVSEEYMQFGPCLITRIIKNTPLENDVYYIPNDMTCPYLPDEMHKLFFTNINQITENTFCIHWYNGSTHSREYCANFDVNNIIKEHCIFEEILSKILYMKRHDFFYNNNLFFFSYNEKDSSEICCVGEIVQNNEYVLNNFTNTVNKHFIDIGANCGVATIILAKQNPLSTIYSFEPDKDLFDILTNNVLLNNLTNVKLFNLAVGKNGLKTLQLCKHPNYSGGNTTQSTPENMQDFFNTETIDNYFIDCISLDEIFLNNNIDEVELLKIDCEGAEYDVLYASNCLKIGLIKNMVGEFHNLKYNNNCSMAEDLVNYCKPFIKNIFKISTLTI